MNYWHHKRFSLICLHLTHRFDRRKIHREPSETFWWQYSSSMPEAQTLGFTVHIWHASRHDSHRRKPQSTLRRNTQVCFIHIEETYGCTEQQNRKFYISKFNSSPEIEGRYGWHDKESKECFPGHNTWRDIHQTGMETVYGFPNWKLWVRLGVEGGGGGAPRF